MFTGIVEKIGRTIVAETSAAGMRIRLDTGYSDLALGESVAINGVCLTVTESNQEGLAEFFISAESLRRTNLGSIQRNTLVNLERALRADTRLSGHWVQGHVDGTAVLKSVKAEGESFEVRFTLDEDLTRYCVEKGSITLNGVSLTVSTVSRDEVSVHLIPHTWKHTNLSSLQIGNLVNVEVDVLAKYVERLCRPYLKR